MNRTKLQKGSALSIMLILAMGVGSVVTSFLGRTLVEQSRVSQRAAAMRAYRQAVGQLELAKAIVNAAPWAGGENTAVTAAIAANPPVIPGTGVYVESVGPAHWFRLTSCGDYSDQSSAVTAFMRDGTPYVSYNYYVEEHPLGISGAPRGKIHTNKELEFYFANGFYDGFVSASNGFQYKFGAAPANTTLAGGSDPGSAVKDLLDLIDFNQLRAQASVVTPPLQEAVVTMINQNVKVDLYDKPSVIQVPVQKNIQVLTGWALVPVVQTVYVKQWQWVNVQLSQKVWVPVTVTNNGTDVGGGGGAGGYWKTVYYWQMQYKLVNVPNGTITVNQWKPQYVTQTVTVMVNQTVPGTLQSSNLYPADGRVIFVSDVVKGMSGNLNGRVTIVSDHDITITGSLRYVDSNGQFACLNGLTPAQPYDVNPAFKRDHALGVIAKGDVKYSRAAPATMEVNASLISAAGMVGMEGIQLDPNGTNPTLSGAAAVKTSLRRFGTIMSSKRPVSTLLDNANQVIHGFQQGSSQYDDGLVMIVPPGYPSEEVTMWEPAVREEGPAFTEAGTGTFDPTMVTPVINTLMSIVTVKGLVCGLNFDWGT